MRRTSLLALLGSGALLALGPACATPPEERAQPDPEAPAVPSIEEVRRDIEQAVGQARADEPAQCAVVGFGERPCGGPRFYRAYSTLETDSAALHELVELYDRLDRQRNLEQGRVSTCEVLPRPSVRLEGGRCVTM